MHREPTRARPLIAAAPAAAEPASAALGAPERSGAARLVARPSDRAGQLAAARGDRRRALADAWRALWVSRLVVWAAGVAGALTIGRSAQSRLFDPHGATAPLGGVGDVLLGPAARWDAVWYLGIASGGYSEPVQSAFFPLYPLLIRVLGAPAAGLIGAPRAHVLAGLALSLSGFAVALYVVHRLAALELGPRAARLTAWLLALFPTAFAFSAVYTESLFLALSAGSIYAGRLGRWRWAGTLGALAAATRSTGLLLAPVLAVLYAYGARGACAAPPPRGTGWRRVLARHRVGPDAAWLLLVPLGLAAYLAYLAAATGDPFSPFHVQEAWYRHFAGPVGGVRDGAVAAFAGVRQLLSGSRAPVYFSPAGGDPFFVAAHNVADFAFLLAAAVALVGALRRLPAAYGAWALVSVLAAVSYPAAPEPLASVPRYLAVVFPLHMWLAAALDARPRAQRVVLAVAAAGLAGLTVLFAAWEWVA